MVKFLLIVGIVAYSLYKVGSFLFKLGAFSQQVRNNQPPGNINRNANGRSRGKSKVYGEYIDYEEVKKD
jgi:hypothetical protein